MVHSPRRSAVLVVLALCASLLCAHVVDASWSATTGSVGSTFATGSIAAPTGASATAGLVLTIKLTWTAPGAAQQGTGTRIDRNVGGGAYTTLTTVSPGSVATYTDSGLTIATAYCYKLTTVDALWTAGPTAPVCATAL
jgi:hypothetical protein